MQKEALVMNQAFFVAVNIICIEIQKATNAAAQPELLDFFTGIKLPTSVVLHKGALRWPMCTCFTGTNRCRKAILILLFIGTYLYKK